MAVKGMEEVLLMDTTLTSELVQTAAADTVTLSGALPPTRYARHGLSNPCFDPLLWYVADAVMHDFGNRYGDGFSYGNGKGGSFGYGYQQLHGDAYGDGYGDGDGSGYGYGYHCGSGDGSYHAYGHVKYLPSF